MKVLTSVLISVVLLFGQDKGSVSGIVTSKKSGDPLIGVNVMIKGTYYGSATSIE